jgi:hypothetical protein
MVVGSIALSFVQAEPSGAAASRFTVQSNLFASALAIQK